MYMCAEGTIVCSHTCPQPTSALQHNGALSYFQISNEDTLGTSYEALSDVTASSADQT